MSDEQRPMILTLLAALAIITGVFSLIRGGLLIFGGISQLVGGTGGIAEIIIGVLSLAVGAIALVSGLNVMRNKTGSINILKIYAAALLGYNFIWVIYASFSDGKISWMSIILEVFIGLATLALIKTNGEIKSYRESAGKP